MQSQIMLLKPDNTISTKYTRNHFGSVATPVSYLWCNYCCFLVKYWFAHSFCILNMITILLSYSKNKRVFNRSLNFHSGWFMLYILRSLPKKRVSLNFQRQCSTATHGSNTESYLEWKICFSQEIIQVLKLGSSHLMTKQTEENVSETSATTLLPVPHQY